MMENVIYNELRARGFQVDVGVVPFRRPTTQERGQMEIDFVANLGNNRYYIQSALQISDTEKEKQEKASLLKENSLEL